jgi:hypothetical protein
MNNTPLKAFVAGQQVVSLGTTLKHGDRVIYARNKKRGTVVCAGDGKATVIFDGSSDMTPWIPLAELRAIRERGKRAA